MAWGRKGCYKPSGKVAHAPWEKRDSWLKLGRRRKGMGNHKQIYMQSSLDNAGSHGNGTIERRGLTSPAGRWMSETKMETEGGASNNGTH